MFPFYDFRSYQPEEVYRQFFRLYSTDHPVYADKSFFISFSYEDFDASQLQLRTSPSGFFDVTIRCKSNQETMRVRVFCSREASDGYLLIPLSLEGRILPMRLFASDILQAMNQLLPMDERWDPQTLMNYTIPLYRTLLFYLEAEQKIEFLKLFHIEDVRFHRDLDLNGSHFQCEVFFNGHAILFGTFLSRFKVKPISGYGNSLCQSCFSFMSKDLTKKFHFMDQHYSRDASFNHYLLCLCVHHFLDNKQNQLKLLFDPSCFKPISDYTTTFDSVSLFDRLYLDRLVRF